METYAAGLLVNDSWLNKEIQAIRIERLRDKCPQDKKGDNTMMLRFILFLTFISATFYITKSHADIMLCPHCSSDIVIETTAREVVGAGCWCDNCDMFYCHGNKCPYCGFRRK